MEIILKTADETGSSLIIMGAKGLVESPRFLLGSIAQQTMRYAKCSILLSKNRVTNIRRVLLATDGSFPPGDLSGEDYYQLTLRSYCSHNSWFSKSIFERC